MNFIVDAHIAPYADPKQVMKECLALLPTTGHHDPTIDFGSPQGKNGHAYAAFHFNTKEEAAKYRDSLKNIKEIFSLWLGERGIDF